MGGRWIGDGVVLGLEFETVEGLLLRGGLLLVVGLHVEGLLDRL